MSNPKVLFLTRDHTNQVERSSFYLATELKKQTELVLWHQDGYIKKILSLLPFKPDFILLNDFKPDYCPIIRGLDEVSIPKGIIMHDLHYKKAKRKQFIDKSNIHYIFTHYKSAFMEWFPEYSDRMIWFPHHVNTNIFRDYQVEKTINWLMMGAEYPELYPVRNRMKSSMMREEGFLSYSHPGYRELSPKDNTVLIGENYAKEINRAKMFLTCDSKYKFPLLKYFEVLACNTLLLATGSEELRELGFIDGETYVEVNEHNFKEKAYYYLKHADERITVSKNGFKMVQAKHSTEQRVQELLKHIKECK